MPEVMSPEANAELSRSIQRRADCQVRNQGWPEARIEQGKAGCQYAGFGLKAADERAVRLQALEAGNGFRRRAVAMLDKYNIGRYQAVVRRAWMPPQLTGKWCPAFVVPLDGRNGWHEAKK
ncbi:hypothetical protein GCM10027081_23040 [Cupriavidus yeoncheonensis]